MQALAGSPGTESEVFFLFFLIFYNFFPIWRPRFSNYPYLGEASDSARASILRRAIRTSPTVMPDGKKRTAEENQRGLEYLEQDTT